MTAGGSWIFGASPNPIPDPNDPCRIPSPELQAANPIKLIIKKNLPASFLISRLSNVPEGYSISNTTYIGWCVDYYDKITENVSYQATVYSTLETLPPSRQNPNYDRVNYILNHKRGNGIDVQAAIWHFIGGPVPVYDSVFYPASATALALIADAMDHGAGFVPGSGQIVAVLLDLGPHAQLNIIEVPCFSFMPVCDFSSFLFLDTNRNGTNEANEPFLTNIVISLADCGGHLLASTVTDSNGFFSFQIPNPLPASFRLLLGNSNTPAFPGSFGLTNLGECFVISNDCQSPSLIPVIPIAPVNAFIGGVLWVDTNGDGLREPGEPARPGVVIRLMRGNTIVATATSAANGSYSFSGVVPGTYHVRVIPPAKFGFTKKDQGSDDQRDSDVDAAGDTGNFTVVEGQVDGSRDAGLLAYPKSGGFAWHDANRNGVLDIGEVAFPSISIILFQGSTPIATNVTSGDGSFLFPDVAPGTYSLKFIKPPGYQFTLPNQGTNELADSDADSNGDTVSFSLLLGQIDTSHSAGFVPIPMLTAIVGGFAWDDVNRNGLRDPGEIGIANVAVELLQGAAVVMTNFTGANGTYAFTNVSPGTYRIHFQNPASFAFTARNRGSNHSLDSDADTDGFTANLTLAAGQVDFTWSAGLTHFPSVGGFTWLDPDFDGILDSTEIAATNVTVQLFRGSTRIASTSTAVNGTYHFATVIPGSYHIKFVAPAGYAFTKPNQGTNNLIDSDASASGDTGSFTVAQNHDDFSWCAGLTRLPAIHGVVWNDTNENGIRDPGELGRAGVTVQLHRGSTLVTNITTGPNGIYDLPSLDPGAYRVKVVAPAGTAFTLPNVGTNALTNSGVDAAGNSGTISLVLGNPDVIVAAGLVAVNPATARVGGLTWLDANHDGIRQSQESGLSGITVQMLAATNIVATVTSGPEGAYAFTNIPPGAYQLRFSTLSGYAFTLENRGGNDALDSDVNADGDTALFKLVAGQADLTRFAGLTPLPYVGGFVWEDLNKNGRNETGEPSRANVAVILARGNSPIATNLTAANGTYRFANLPPGAYRVKFVAPPGFSFTDPNKGSNDSLDSDADRNGNSSTVVINFGKPAPAVAAGLYRPGVIGGLVWLDLDRDAAADSGEPGVANVTVRLWDSGNKIVGSATTDVSGHYSFTNVLPGPYTVQFIALSNLDFTIPVGGVTPSFFITSGQTNLTTDAGLATFGVIRGTIWCDGNRDGLFTRGEPLLAGIPVRLINTNGVILTETFTGKDGRYSFHLSQPGILRVQISPPAGLTFTPARVNPEALDSDIDPDTGLSAPINIAPGSTIIVDVGLKKVIRFESTTQAKWAAPPEGKNPSGMLSLWWNTLYKSGEIVIGGTRSIHFTTSARVIGFMPASQTPGKLTQNWINPVITEAGALAGETLALKLNCDFSNHNLNQPGFDRLRVAPGYKLAQKTVREVFTLANQVLGGNFIAVSPGVTVAELTDTLRRINRNFEDGRDEGFLVY